MANFFKEYGVQAYQKKHKDESIEEIETSNLKGHEAPDPKTFSNRKQSARNKAIYGSIMEDEQN